MFARAVPLGNALPAAIVVNFSSSSGVISANSVTRSVVGRRAVVCVIVSFMISEGGCALCLRIIRKSRNSQWLNFLKTGKNGKMACMCFLFLRNDQTWTNSKNNLSKNSENA